MRRRSVLRLFPIALCLTLTVAPAEAADSWVDLGPAPAGTPPVVEMREVAGGVAVDVGLSGFYTEDRSLARGTFAVLEVPEFGRQGAVGEPELPFRTVLIPVANGPVASMSVLDGDSSVVMTGVTVMPRQAPAPDCGSDEPEFVMDDKAYAADRWFPAEPARISDDVVVRGQRFLVVEVSPLSFNPARREVAAQRELHLTIELVGDVDRRAEVLKEARRSALFPTATDLDAAQVLDAVPTGVEYLIIADDALASAFEPLAEWKRKKGMTVEIVLMSTVGTSSADLKSYLQARYDADPDLTYVLLGGDHPAVPSQDVGGMVTDLYYSCLDGSDYLPDVVMGRIAVQTLADCQNVVTKILDFDRDVVPGAWHGDYLMAAYLQGGCTAERWFFETGTHAMHFIRDQAGMGIHTAATSDNLSCTTYYWRGDSYPHRFAGYAGQPVPSDDADLITASSQSTQDLTAALNGGVSLVQHRDHGDVTGWGDPPFYNSHVNGLTNGSMTPVVFSINCLTGTFDTSGDCFAEAFMKKYPGGAVGVMAATDLSYSGYNDLLVHGSYDSFWDDYDPADGGNIYPHSFRPAEAYLYGKYYMYNWEGPSASFTQLEFELFHWHGDPEMRVFTAVPAPPAVTVDPAIPVGSLTLTVTADADAALVAVTDDGVLVGRGTVSGGIAVIDLTPVPEEPATLDVVVTGLNLVPWQGTVEVIVPEGPWMAHRSHLIDDSAGNGDGIANPGEAIVLPITVENIGADDGTAISGVLGSGSGLVTVTDAAADFPDAVVGAQVQSLGDHFAIAVGAGAANGHVANLTLTWSASGGYAGDTIFSVPVCEPLFISDVSVDFVDHESAIVSWTTNLPASSQATFGVGTPSTVVEVPGTTTDHVVEIEGLDPCTAYVVQVASTSPNCYTAVDDNGGDYYPVETAGWGVVFSETFDSDPGWAIDNGNEPPATGWGFGQPTGQAQDSYGGPDPTSGATGDYVYGVNLGGDISPNLAENELKLTTPVVDLSTATTAQVRFQRWLGVERDTYDNARIRLSTDGGTTWSTVWENGGDTIDDTAWSEMVVDLPAAAGQSQVQVQWTYGSTDGSWNYCGWNIDDVVIEGSIPCSALTAVFADGFETGDCGAWSSMVP